MANLFDTEIAQTIAEKLYEEVPVEACDTCTFYEENANSGVCSLEIFEESKCPLVKARLIQTRDSLIALLPTDIRDL